MVLDAYTREIYPMEHLVYFNTRMVINGHSDVVKRKMLPSTFKKLTMTWFTIQQPQFIVYKSSVHVEDGMLEFCIVAFEYDLRAGLEQ